MRYPVPKGQWKFSEVVTLTYTFADDEGISDNLTFVLTGNGETYRLIDILLYIDHLKVVTDVDVHRSGEYSGTVKVSYRDGSADEVPVKVVVTDSIKPDAPVVHTVVALDTTVSGTGEPGAALTVYFENGIKGEAIVGRDGSWTVAVPAGITLSKDDELIVVQADAADNTSEETKIKVISMADHYTPMSIRQYLEYLSDKTAHDYSNSVQLPTLPEGTTVALKEDAGVDTSLIGDGQEATVTVTYPDDSAEEVAVPVTVRDTTRPDAPSINPVTALDSAITGTGEAGAFVTLMVTDSEGKVHTLGPVEVGVDGTWSVSVALQDGGRLLGGHSIKATQADQSGNISDPASAVVNTMASNYEPQAKQVTLEVGSQASYTVSEHDLAADPALPGGLVYEGATVDTSAVGNDQAALTIRYADGSIDTAMVPVQVQDTKPPVIDAANATLMEKTAMSAAGVAYVDPALINQYVSIQVTDLGDSAPSLHASGLPAGLSYNMAESRLEGTAQIGGWGMTEESRDLTIDLTATDRFGNQSTGGITLTILRDTDGDGNPDATDPDDDNDGIADTDDPKPKLPDNTPPVISIPPMKVVNEKQPIEPIAISASDDANQPVTIGVSGLPDGLSFDADSGEVTGTPQIPDWHLLEEGRHEEARVFVVTITAKDASSTSEAAKETFSIIVLRDTDGDGEPDVTDPDDDNDGIPDLLDVEPKTADTTLPALDKPANVIVTENMPITAMAVNASDNSGIPPKVTMMGAPEGIQLQLEYGDTIGSTQGSISGTPGGISWQDDPASGAYENERSFDITLVAKDLSGNETAQRFVITVQRDTDGDGTPDAVDSDDDNDGIPDDKDPFPKEADSQAPVIQPMNPMTVLESATLGVPVVVSDDSSLEPTVSIQFAPEGVRYDAAQKRILGQPQINWGMTEDGQPEESQSFPILVKAVDASGNVSSITFLLKVERDTDHDGIPDSEDVDDDGDGIPDADDTTPKDFTALVVTLSPSTMTVTDGAAITPVKLTENKMATQRLSYAAAHGSVPAGLKLDEEANSVQGTLSGLKWSDDKTAPNYEQQLVTLTVHSVGAHDQDMDQDIVQITVLRDSDQDGIPDTEDEDDDNDGIPDEADAAPKTYNALKVEVSPLTQTVTEFMPIAPIQITENKEAEQVLSYTGGAFGLSVNEGSNQATGTLVGLTWSNDAQDSHYERQTITVIIDSLGSSPEDVDSNSVQITVLRDTDGDGIPDVDDLDDDNDSIPDDQDDTPKERDQLLVIIAPAAQRVVEGKPIADLVIRENKPASQTITGLSGLKVDDVRGLITGTITDALTWSDQADAPNCEEKELRLTVVSTAGEEEQVDTILFTILRDTDQDGIPDKDDKDDDNDGIPDDQDPAPKTPDQKAPTLESIKDVSVLEGKDILPIPVKAEDDSGIQPGITVSGQPEGIRLNNQQLEGKPLVDDWGDAEESRSYLISVTATDLSGNHTTVSFRMSVLRDTDQDGIPDVDDPDDDNDGIPDSKDPEPKVPDTTKPDAPVVKPVAQGDSTISGTGEPGAVVTITYPDGTQQEVTVGEDGAWTATVPEGQELKAEDIIRTTQTDAAGNQSDPVNTTVLDTQAPDAPLIKSIGEGGKQITGTGEPGAVVTITYPDGKTQQVAVAEDGSWKAALPKGQELKAGDTITAVQTDAAGNQSEPAKETVTDTTAPATPVINSISEGDRKISGTGEPSATVTIVYPDGATQEVTVSEDGSWTATMPEGKELKAGDTITVTQTDAAGNQSESVKVTVSDTTAPAAPVINPISEGDRQISGTGEPGATVTVVYPDGTMQEVTVGEDGSWTATVPEGKELKSGDTITVTQTDAAGNQSEPVQAMVTARGLQPQRLETMPRLMAVMEGTQMMTGTGIPGTTIVLTVDNGSPLTSTVDSQGLWSIRTNTRLKASSDIRLHLQDADGRQSDEIMSKVLPMADTDSKR